MHSIIAKQDARLEKVTKAEINYKKSPRERITRAYIESRLETLEKVWQEFNEDHLLLVSTAKPADKLEEQYFKDDVETEFEEHCTGYKTLLKEHLSRIIAAYKSPASASESEGPKRSNPEHEIKLPPIDLPEFRGSYEEWQTFYDLFTALVHNNSSLSAVQKFRYLKCKVLGEAGNILKNFTTTNENYDEAWTQLVRRYNNKRYNSNIIFKRLFNQKNITSESAYNIKQLLDTTTSCLKSLNNLEIKTESWDAIVIYLVVSKLDSETHKQWEHHVSLLSLDEMPTWKYLVEFLESKFRTLEIIDNKRGFQKSYTTNENTTGTIKKKSFHTAINQENINNTNTKTCTICSGNHLLYQCKHFSKMTSQERHKFAQSKHLCYNCLAPSHQVKNCFQTSSCRRCGRRHHSLLHPEQMSNQHDNNQSEPQNQERDNQSKPLKGESGRRVSTNFSKGEVPDDSDSVLLATAIVKTKSISGHTHFVRCLLDQGSQASFITETTVQLLGLAQSYVNGIVSGLGAGETKIRKMVTFVIQARHDPDHLIQVNAYVLKSLTSLLPASRILDCHWPELGQLPLADPEYRSPSEINVLLGAEVYGEVLLDGVIKHPQGSVAQKTLLGWIISGKINNKSTSPVTKLISLHVNLSEDNFLKQFWQLENEPDNLIKPFNSDELKCEEIFESTTKRDQVGRYVIRLPFKESDPKCQYGQSDKIAIRRFNMLERKLLKNPSLYSEYKSVIAEYLSLDHMALVPDDEINNPNAVYLPHHAVVREDKVSTKVRVVFDASCKGLNHVSLNNDLLVGPKLQQDLCHILMRWRFHPICLVGDLVKMYRQVRVHSADADFQRIVWRFDPNQPLQHCRLLTLTFGTACAPYLAVRALQQLARDEETRFPKASSITLKDFYMDDLLTGCETVEEAVEICTALNQLMKAGGFELQKWCSNSPEVLKFIETNKQLQSQNITIRINESIKILGISWNKESDQFEFTVRLPDDDNPITKRTILSEIARIFDPLGWISPVVVIAKSFIQKLWKAELDWDKELSSNLLDEWTKFRSDLVNIELIKINRWVFCKSQYQIELHAFADASPLAYAAVLYVRTISPDGSIHVSLLTSKTKVAPADKNISIPRLELCAAVLAAKLLFEASQILHVSKESLYAWSDSTVVLAWLKAGSSRWTTFVSNRVTQILNITDYIQWAHTSTKCNPADCASRGMLPRDLVNHALWWDGPQWLQSSIPDRSQVNCQEFDTNEEMKPLKSFTVTVKPKEFNFIWVKFSRLDKMLRIMCYCKRVLNYKLPISNRQSFGINVSPQELQNMSKIVVKQTQEFYFEEQIKHLRSQLPLPKRDPLHGLSPFFDEDGILRVGGRTDLSPENFDQRHPIILPSKCHLTKLIILDAHQRTLHGGPQLMINFLRSKYWIIRCRDQVKSCYHSCVKCLRYRKQVPNQLMGQLPEVRLKPSKPFISSGVDYAGPINVRFAPGRGSKSYKGYICLFVCMCTKAIHLEVVSDMSSQGFISAFRRFVSRRGRCLKLYSDNGTNFVGAEKQLRDMFHNANSLLSNELVQLLSLENTSWHFIPPNAPNFGGLWEAGVKSTKKHLKRIIGDSTLTIQELSTALSQIEACLNSRPITFISDHPDDLQPLTPGHFLVGEPLVNIADVDYLDQNITALQRWQLVQRMVGEFWRRWSREYVVTLNQKYKWANKQPEPDIDDIVIVRDDNLPPCKWILGRVVEKHVGRDNLTRVVTIKCKNTILKRPCNKLCVLPKE